MNIAISLDLSFQSHASVMLTSLRRNSKMEIRLFIFSNVDELKFDDKFLKFVYKNFPCTQFVLLDHPEFSIFKVSHHVSALTYGRLFIPTILFEKYCVDRVVYFDCDIIIKNDKVLDLYELDLGSKTLGAVCETRSSPQALKLGMVKDAKYFNAGVLLINCKSWVGENITRKLLSKYYEIEDEIVYWDQDVLNAFFNENFLDIAGVYNFHEGVTGWGCKLEPVVVHFAGPIKPWSIEGWRLLYFKDYFYFKMQSPYKFKPVFLLRMFLNYLGQI